jgi:1-acyl-sn-glycerol-3-phosphate acyltransferase
MIRQIRGIATLFFFILFALGGAVLSYIVLPLVWKKEHALKIVRGIWWVLIRCFTVTRLISIDKSALKEPIQGAIILANHPSLIDVVILTALLPRTFSVAKSSLRKNPFFGMVVRRVFLHDDAQLMEEAPALLKKGYNILIFPEGTRSPDPHSMHKWHRGGTQLALRTQSPIQPLVLQFDYRMLAKGQNIFDMGTRPIKITVKPLAQIPALTETPTNYHAIAVRLTRQMASDIQAEINEKA